MKIIVKFIENDNEFTIEGDDTDEIIRKLEDMKEVIKKIGSISKNEAEEESEKTHEEATQESLDIEY